MGGRPANVTHKFSQACHKRLVESRIPVPRGFYTDVGNGTAGRFTNNYSEFPMDSDEDEADDLGMLFHNITVERDFEDDHARHKRLTLALANNQYEDESSTNFKREYAALLNDFDPDYVVSRKSCSGKQYCRIQRDKHHYGVFGELECAYMHMEAPNIPFLETDCIEDYKDMMSRIMARYPVITERNFMAYVSKCHRTISDLVENGYFNVGRLKFDNIARRVVQAIRMTGIVPHATTMMSSGYQVWIDNHRLPKGDKTGEFLWNYMFHFTLMYHPTVKKHVRFKDIMKTLIRSRVDCSRGHMFQSSFTGMLNDAILDIPQDTYKDVASKMFEAMRAQLAECLTLGVSDEFAEAALLVMKVVGTVIATSLVLFMVRHIIGEVHAFTIFLKNLLFPTLTPSQWRQTETEDTSKLAEGHMWEHIQPLVVRFGIMTVQVITGMPTTANEVSNCLRNINYGASFIETILTNVEPLFRMAAYHITGDKMWIHADMDDDINNHLAEVESLRDVPNLHMRLSNDSELCKRVRSSYRWHTSNTASLRSAGIRDKALGTTLGRAERDLFKWYECVVNAANMADSRIVPISIMLSGAVNQGKTTMISAIIKIVHAFYKTHGLHMYDAHTYFSKAKDSEYWDGYNHQIAYIVDEFLASSQAVTRDAQLLELLGIINNGVYPLNFADCKSKGTDVFDSPLVIYTTNFTKWGEIQLTDPEALFKRIHYPLELRRGDEITAGKHVATGWYVTVTEHAMKHKHLYAGTSSEFWKRTISTDKGYSERIWLSFKDFMDMILTDYTERISAKPITDHMGDIDEYCETTFPQHFEGSTDVYDGERFVERLSSSASASCYSSGSFMADCADDISYEELLDSDEHASGHMMKRLFTWGNTTDDEDGDSSSVVFSSSGNGSAIFTHYADHDDNVWESICESLDQCNTLDEAIQLACERLSVIDLEEIFPDLSSDAMTYVNMKYVNGMDVIPQTYKVPFANMVFAHKLMYRVVVNVSRITKDWEAEVYDTLQSAADSLDGVLLPSFYEDQFNTLVSNYYRYARHDKGVILHNKALIYCTKRILEAPPNLSLNRFLWNICGFHLGERRDNGDKDVDMCRELHDHHVCGAFFAKGKARVTPMRRRVNDLVAVMQCVVKHMVTHVSLFSSRVFADMRTSLTPLYLAIARRTPTILLYLGSLLAGAAFGFLVTGITQLIMRMINSYAGGHSETHKNPMFMRKGRTQDQGTKYVASGHSMQAQDAQLAAITTRNSITRHFAIVFKDGEEVKGKCIALGRYLFFHSHVLWAFGEIATLVVCSDSVVQQGGSQMFLPRDFVLYDYMNDTSNKRDLVRLEFTKNSYLGKLPSTYLVPKKKWTAQLASERLIRVLGSGENRKVSIPYVVPDVFRIGRPYGTKIEVDGEVYVKDHEAGYMAYDTPSLPGDCSDPYISGTKLLGLHVGYANGDSVFMPVYLDDCTDNIGVGAMSYVPKVVSGDLCMPSGVVPLGMISKDVTGRAVNPYVPTIYGPRGNEGVGGYRDSVFPLDRVPSPLTGLDGLSPWYKHNLNYTRTHSPPVPIPYALRVSKDPTFFIRDFFHVPSKVRTKRLTDFQVDNGIPGYLVGVDVSTSPGLLGKVLCKKRSDLYERDGDDMLLPGPELLAVSDEIATMIRNNVVPMISCCENLKAETVAPGKLPRCFTGVSIEHLRWTKAVVGDALAYMKKHVVGSSCAVGINPHSVQWEKLYAEFVDGFGSEGNIIAGDLSNCDLSCHPVFVDGMCSLLNMFYKYEIDSLLYRELKFCCMSVLYQVRIRGKRMFELYRGHPSGHYLTTFFNCVVIFSIHRYAYTQLVDCVKYPWVENVRLKVYGDDSLGCVHNRVKKWYNMRTIQPYFALFGMIYTAPDKSLDVPEFIKREDASFLGRGFRSTETVMCAPLGLDAIHGMIHWVRTETLEIDVALDTNIKCALMEMYHHGERAFNNFRSKLYLEGVKRNYVSSVITGPLDYKYFREWHVKTYAGCDDSYAFSADSLTDMFFC